LLAANTTEQPHRRHCPDLLRALEFEGMSGLAHRRFKDRHLAGGSARTLADCYHNNVAVHLACERFMIQLETALQAETFRVMTLKGASLMNRYDSHPGDRPMQDVDLWVASDDRFRLEQVLKSLGFIQNRRRKDTFKGTLLTIDLHTHPLHTERINSRSSLLAADTALLWQHCLPWREAFCRVCRPSDMDNILLLSLHLLKHFYSRLIWLEDIRRLLLNRDQAYMAALLNRSAELGCTRPLLYSLYLLQTLYPDALSERVGMLNLKRSLSATEKGLLMLSIAGRPIPVTATALQLLAMRGMKARFDFALESLFPGRHVIQSEFGIFGPIQHALFIPYRILKTLGLMAQPLRLMYRILYRFGK
jgi:hypothetical protein